MLPGKVLVRLHLLQAGNRPLKLEFETSATVKVQQGPGAGQYQFDVAIVEFIHQIDKPAGLVIRIRTESGHP